MEVSLTYDGVNRMLNATHGTGAYTEKVTGYDKNGNITGLQRYNSSLVDNLTYTYSGNQLSKVEDATGNATGFTNGASQANEYTYDNNGNLTQDLNKGITNISYNVLSLPQVVTFSNGNIITYLYTADGRKLRTVHVTNGTATTTDYCGNVIYENSAQKLLLTKEGYINLSSPTTYYYYLKDHQGNNRVVLSSSGAVQEVNHYYPFGSTFASSNVQPYKYNGKELDTKNGLNWYDYGARHYDAALGRWFVVDPLAEKYYSTSLYGYCDNNPIKYVDPTGEMKVIYNPDGTYKETTHNNWFHNTFMGRQEYIDYGNRMTRLSEDDFWQWQTTGQWGSFKPADGLTSFEFWLDSASDNVIDGAVKFFISEAYSTPNSIAAMFTGRTLGGSLLMPMEKQEKFVDLVNALPVTKFLKVVHPGTAKNFYKAHSTGYFTKQKYQNKVNRYKSIIKRGNAYNKIIDYFVSPLNEINDNKDELDY